MRYASARWRLYQREEAYRVFVSDTIGALAGRSDRYIDRFDTRPPLDAAKVKEKIKSKLRS